MGGFCRLVSHNYRAYATTQVENWTIRVNECNGDITPTIMRRRLTAPELQLLGGVPT
jgi:hypothetical protein